MNIMRHMQNIVISGVSGRFPQCDNIDQLRDQLLSNNDMLSNNANRWPQSLYGLPSRTGILNEIDKFDAAFFGINKDQANNMDPQCRILLELAIEAVLDAG